jgi:hypothetical protein
MVTATFTQAGIKRAVKGAESAGLSIGRVFVHPDGTIEMVCGQSDQTRAQSPLETWKAKKHAR